MTWSVQQAKNRFSELIDRARSDGPQTVTRHGQPMVEIIALGAPFAVAPVGADPAPQAPSGRDDGFATYLLGVPRIGLLETPQRRSRKARSEIDPCSNS